MPQRRTPPPTPRTKQGRQNIAAERASRRRRDIGISAAVAVAFVLVLGSLLFIDAGPGAVAGDDQPAPAAVTDAALVREDSHWLSTAADGNVTFVEFLDFECESCRAAFPVVEQLGLDMAAFNDANNSPATLDRINRDVADGTALGVTGTPTMFLNGNRLQASSEQDLLDAFDAALR